MVLLKITATIHQDSGNFGSNMISIVEMDSETANIIHQYISKGEYTEHSSWQIRIFTSEDSEYTFNSTITSDPIIIENVKKFFGMDQEYHSYCDLVSEILLLKERDHYINYINGLYRIIPEDKNDEDSLIDRMDTELIDEYSDHSYKIKTFQRLKSDINLPETENMLNNIYTLLLFKTYMSKYIDFDKNLKYIIAEYLDYKKYKNELFGEGSGRSLL